MDDLRRDYRQSGFGRRLGFGRRPALLVVDLVQAYADPDSPMYAAAETAVGPASLVLLEARAAGVPVIFTKVLLGPGGQDGGLFAWKIPALELFVEGSPFGEIVDGLAPRQDEAVLTKQYASAFFGTPLDTMLRRADVDTVVIVGCSTSGCVRATAVDAVQLGFRPIVVADAVADRDPRPHEQSLFDLDAKYADVVLADDVVSHLRSLAADGAARRHGTRRETDA